LKRNRTKSSQEP
jgi:hypothetical protein